MGRRTAASRLLGAAASLELSPTVGSVRASRCQSHAAASTSDRHSAARSDALRSRWAPGSVPAAAPSRAGPGNQRPQRPPACQGLPPWHPAPWPLRQASGMSSAPVGRPSGGAGEQDGDGEDLDSGDESGPEDLPLSMAGEGDDAAGEGEGPAPAPGRPSLEAKRPPTPLEKLERSPHLGNALRALRECRTEEEIDAFYDGWWERDGPAGGRAWAERGWNAEETLDMLVNVARRDPQALAASMSHLAGLHRPPRVLLDAALDVFVDALAGEAVPWRTLSLFVDALGRFGCHPAHVHKAGLVGKFQRLENHLAARMDDSPPTPVHLGRVVLGYLRMQRQLRGPLLEAVLRASLVQAPNMNAQALCSMVWGLGRHGLRCGREVPRAWVEAMVSQADAFMKDLVGVDVVQLAEGLDAMHYSPAPALLDRMERVMLYGARDLDTNGIVTFVRALADMGHEVRPEAWDTLVRRLSGSGPEVLGAGGRGGFGVAQAVWACGDPRRRPPVEVMHTIEREIERLWEAGPHRGLQPLVRACIVTGLIRAKYVPRHPGARRDFYSVLSHHLKGSARDGRDPWEEVGRWRYHGAPWRDFVYLFSRRTRERQLRRQGRRDGGPDP